jgi:hypothetical protein
MSGVLWVGKTRKKEAHRNNAFVVLAESLGSAGGLHRYTVQIRSSSHHSVVVRFVNVVGGDAVLVMLEWGGVSL